MKPWRIGTRVKTIMGCRLTGTVCQSLSLSRCNDGTYSIKAGYTSVKWDDGTQGRIAPQYLEEIRI